MGKIFMKVLIRKQFLIIIFFGLTPAEIMLGFCARVESLRSQICREFRVRVRVTSRRPRKMNVDEMEEEPEGLTND